MFWRKRTISKISITPPTGLPNRAGLGIVLIVKDEAAYLPEWVSFHRALGVRHFIVYDNGCTDGAMNVLRDLLPPDALTIVPWDQTLKDGRSGAEIHNQVLAYAHALRNFGAGFRWLAFIDVDEFLVPAQAPDLLAALDDLSDHAHISLPWHMFGRNGHDTPPPGGILENYLYRSDPLTDKRGVNWKCIVDPTRVTGVRVHGFDIDGARIGVNDVGVLATHKDRRNRAFYSRAAIQLNHYFTRSDAELRDKINRGATTTVEAETHRARVMRIVDAIEKTQIEDTLARDVQQRLNR